MTSNVWTMGQQFIVIRNMPTPGSEAWRARQARLKAKGKLTDEEVRVLDAQTPTKAEGQRQQPVSSKRAKKKGK